MAGLAAELLLGPLGSPLAGAAGAAGTVGVCAALGAAVYAFRKRIPHPTEFALIGCCFLRGGCHEHEAMNIIIEVHDAENVPIGGAVYAYAEAGRFDVQSGSAKVKDKRAEIFERMNLHVRQKDPDLTLSLWQKGLVGSVSLGTVKLNLVRDIINRDWPQEQWYTIEKDGRMTCRVKLSFHRVDAYNATPLLEYALIKANRAALERGEPVPAQIDFESLEPTEQLNFLSSVLEGPLKVMGSFGWKSLYFKPTCKTPGRWFWRGWKDKQEAVGNVKKPTMSIPLFAVTKVVSDKRNRQQFIVSWRHSDGSDETLLFNRVDRDRDIWSEGLYEFVKRLHIYLETEQSVTQQVNKYRNGPIILKKGEGIGLRRRGYVYSPPKTKPPQALEKMMEQIAQGWEEEDDSSLYSAGEDGEGEQESPPGSPPISPPQSPKDGGTPPFNKVDSTGGPL